MKFRLLILMVVLTATTLCGQENRQDSLDVLFRAGRMCAAFGQTKEALGYYLGTDRIYRELHGDDGVKRYSILYEVGLCFFRLEQPKYGINAFTEALRVADHWEVEDDIVFKLLKSLSTASNLIGNYPLGIAYARRAYQVQRSLEPNDPTDYYDANLYLGSSFLYNRMPDSAITYFEIALSSYNEYGENRMLGKDVIRLYHELGMSYLDLGKTDKALSLLEEALEKAIRRVEHKGSIPGPDYPSLYTAHGNLGDAYTKLGRYQEALEILRKKLEYQLKHGDSKVGFASTYNSIGSALSHLGLNVEALAYYNKAIEEIPRSYEGNRVLGAVYDNLGTVYRQLGNRQRAINLKQKGLQANIELLSPQATEIAYAYNNLSVLQGEEGEWSAALSSLDAGLEILGPKLRVGYPDLIELELNKAGILLKLGRYQEAKSLAQSTKANALLLLDERPDLVVQAFTLLGREEVWPDQPDSARFYNLAAIDRQSARSTQDLNTMVIVRGNYARFLLGQGNATGALDQLRLVNKFLEINSNTTWDQLILPYDYFIWLPLYISASIDVLLQHPSTENYAKTQTLFEQASKGALFLRGRGVAAEQLLKYEREIQEANSRLYFSISGEFERPEEGLFRALLGADRAKSRLIAAELQRVQIEGDVYFPKSLSLKLDSVRAARSMLNLLADKVRREEASNSDSLKHYILSERERLYAEEEQCLAELKRISPKYHLARFAETNWTLPEVRSTLLTPNQAILSYLVTDSSTYIFLLRQDTLVAYKQKVAEKYLDTLTKRFVEVGIKDYVATKDLSGIPARSVTSLSSLASDGQELYQLLLAPLAAHLPERLTIIPDGTLALLPFAALSTGPPKRAGRWASYPFLVREHMISYGFSINQQLRMKNMETSGKGWFGLAPFAKEDTAQLAAAANRSTFLGDPQPALGGLKASGPEVYDIARMTGGLAYLRQDANRNALLSAAKKAQVLHLATHGVPNKKIPQDAFLAVAGADTAQYDPLRAGEIYGLELSAEMVVLSACESGVGRLLTGEGPQSLERAFAYAGARSLVSSLWPANDSQTSALMVCFYQGLQQGLSRAAALHQAMKSIYLSPINGAQHPYYWAGWMLRGADESLELR